VPLVFEPEPPPVVPPLASPGRPVESVPVDGLAAAADGVAVVSGGIVLLPVSARVGRPGPGSEFTRVSLRPQPPRQNADASVVAASNARNCVPFIEYNTALRCRLRATHHCATTRLATEPGLCAFHRAARLAAVAAQFARGVIDFMTLGGNAWPILAGRFCFGRHNDVTVRHRAGWFRTRCQLRGHLRGDIPRRNDLGEMREPIDAPETKQMEGAVALSRHGAMTQSGRL
jgi:hypothetical protein